MIHEQHALYLQDWLKWRYAYLGGTPFINKYLYRYSDLESDTDYALRKKLSYSPSFAKSAVNEVRNSIYERMSGIIRTSTDKNYLLATTGLSGGVDYQNSSMNYFMGTKVLPELLVMAKVIICVDKPRYDPDASLADTYKYRPYLYYYCREQLLNWATDEYFNLTMVELQDNYYDQNSALQSRTRKYELKDNVVILTIENQEPIIINIPRIPIVIAQISNSLMEDIADYQIALLNLTSSDMSFIYNASFPFYAEKYLPGAELAGNLGNQNATDTAKQIKIGTKKGRRFPNQLDYPEFISPPTDPLKASMEKQEQLKKDIRSLINLTLSNLTTARMSADSKQEDRSREETGLSYIGLELEAAENQILEIWNLYNASKEGRVIYPVHYNLKTTIEVLEEGNKLIDHSKEISSKTYRKEIAKKVAKSVFEGTLAVEKLNKIFKEIDETDVVLANPDTLNKDLEAGIVSKDYASKLRGYPDDEVCKANEEQALRAKLIADAQGRNNPAARGVPDLSVDPKAEAKEEKSDALGKKLPVRGEGK